MAVSDDKTSNFDRRIVEGPLGRALWRLAWPTMLQNAIGGLQGIVDHAMVGRYVGYVGNAAVGVSWQIFLLVIVFISSLFSGMAVLVARYAGANDSESVNRVVYQAFLAAILLSYGLLAPLGYLFTPSLLRLVNASPEVVAEAEGYLRIMFVFSIGMLVFFMLGGALRAAGDARTPLRLGVVLTGLNVALNVILIRGLGPIPAMGTRGSALGTVIASGIVAIYGIVLLFRGGHVIKFHRGMRLRPDWKIIAALFRFGLPTGVQGVAMNIGGVVLLRYVGAVQFSAEAQAAFVVCYSQLFSLLSWTANALMSATAAVVGQNLGAKQAGRAMIAPRAGVALALMLAVPIATAFLTIPGQLLALFGLDSPIVLALGRELLAYLSVSCVLLGSALVFTGALQGTGDTKSPLYITLISQVALPVGLCAIIEAARGLSPTDIWLAIVVGHLSRAVLSFLRFRQGKWRHIEVAIAGAGP